MSPSRRKRCWPGIRDIAHHLRMSHFIVFKAQKQASRTYLCASREGGIVQGRFIRTIWYERGIEYGNPYFNARFRVNAPEASLAPAVYVPGRGPGQWDDADSHRRGPGPSRRRRAVLRDLGRASRHDPQAGRASMDAAPMRCPRWARQTGHCTHQYPTVRAQAHGPGQRLQCDPVSPAIRARVSGATLSWTMPACGWRSSPGIPTSWPPGWTILTPTFACACARPRHGAGVVSARRSTRTRISQRRYVGLL